MNHSAPPPDAASTFTAVYEAVRPDLVRFVQRRAHPDHVDDIVADALTVVWRRLDELPTDPDDVRAWAFGITRNVMLNARRGAQRTVALRVRVADAAVPTAPGVDVEVVRRVDLARAWTLLSEVHQEALSLAVFEDLTATRAAAVLDISPVAFRLRLSRARRALRLHLDHLPATPTRLERTSAP